MGRRSVRAVRVATRGEEEEVYEDEEDDPFSLVDLV
jgi:hypothetical protein